MRENLGKRMHLRVSLWIALCFVFGFASSAWGGSAIEQRCTELGANCLGSETLDSDMVFILDGGPGNILRTIASRRKVP